VKILVLNSGSSSVKCQYFIDQKSIATALIERIGEEVSHSEIRYNEKVFTYQDPISNHQQAFDTLFSMLKGSHALSSIEDLDAVGHRVVHGGSDFSEPTLVNKEVIENIRSLIPLAPLHNPANLKAIEIIAKAHPDLVQVAVLILHSTRPCQSMLHSILSLMNSIRNPTSDVTAFMVPLMLMWLKKQQK